MGGVSKWIESVWGNVCERYRGMLASAVGRRGLIDVMLTAEGAEFMANQSEWGVGVPYDVLRNEFGRYINGKYVYEDESGYTSECYVGAGFGVVPLRCTQTMFLGYVGEVHIGEGEFRRIVVDAMSEIRLVMGKGSRVRAYMAKGGYVDVEGEGKIEYEC